MSDGQVLYMPVNTSPGFVNKVHDDVVAALAYPPVKQKFIDINVLTVSSTTAKATAYLKGQMAKWGAVIKDANIKLE